MNWLKQIFRKPSPLELAARELVDAEHALLVAQTGKDWAEMSVEYNTRRINRLKQHIEMNDEDMDWLQEVKAFAIDGAIVFAVFGILVAIFFAAGVLT